MTDEHYPPRLKIRGYRHDPSTRTVWIQVEGFYSMDLGVNNGIREGDPLYIFKQQDIDRILTEINTLNHENITLRDTIDKYKEYFGLQKKLQERSE